ncbi:hypothetical protein [Halomarina rubra]|uniref:Uncharacterized protein n=1 Tax=Halomarina rubra TaxID=2071873 RepID=A0ABD6AS58_9EURY|nr:hypothetical protein [Halomarina rubra]
MPGPKCKSCSKPLGNSADGRCHDCGGKTYRGGKPFNTGAGWKAEIGLLGKLRSILGGDDDE